MQRKVVYWFNQGHTEAFTKTPNGWVESDYMDWPAGSYEYFEIRATTEEFVHRKDGCVCI